MVFSSLLFLCLFFPAVLLLVYITPNIKGKNLILVLSSLLFYAWGEPRCVLLLLMSATLDYSMSLIIGKNYGKWQNRTALLASIIFDIGVLMIFKYAGFFAENINMLTGLEITVPQIALPIGISFYTFQTLSYTIDVYLGKVPPQKSLLNYLTYLTMFPQLVAGPIVRYVDVAKQVEKRHVTFEKFSQGAVRFTVGLSKKVILANNAGSAASMLLDSSDLMFSTGSAWLGILLYAFQIYFDFAGYSEMAIGMGKMFGFDFLENFNYPYISKNATEFWRRWHMSLSSFFRDYVYIPLGGNRRHHIRNIFVVWFLTGFWHGASWNFILWGLYYGVLLLIEKKMFKGALLKMPSVIGHIYNSVVVLIGWALFYYTDMEMLGRFFTYAFGFGGSLYNLTTVTTLLSNVWLIIACVVASTPLMKNLYHKTIAKNRSVDTVVSSVLMVGAFAVCFVLLVGQTYNPFLYFRF